MQSLIMLSQIKADPSLPSHCFQTMLSFWHQDVSCARGKASMFIPFFGVHIDRPLSSSKMMFSLSTHNDNRLSYQSLSAFNTAQQMFHRCNRDILTSWTRQVLLELGLQGHSFLFWANTSHRLLHNVRNVGSISINHLCLKLIGGCLYASTTNVITIGDLIGVPPHHDIWPVRVQVSLLLTRPTFGRPPQHSGWAACWRHMVEDRAGSDRPLEDMQVKSSQTVFNQPMSWWHNDH